MKKLDFVKTTAAASIFAATIAASPAFANTTATFTVSDDAVKEIATIQRSMMEDADESDSTSYKAGDEMAEGYLDPLDIQNDMPDAVSDEDLLEGEDTAVEVEVNSDTVILPTPEREGYVFIEWNSESDGSGESFQAGDTFVITSEVELFAIWEEKERSSLTLNLNEDSFVKETFFEEEGVTVHAVSTRSAGTSKDADEAVETETGSAKRTILLKKRRFLMIRNLINQKMIVAQRMMIQIANQAAMNNRMMIQAMMKKMKKNKDPF